jgi:hypothetical protein
VGDDLTWEAVAPIQRPYLTGTCRSYARQSLT